MRQFTIFILLGVGLVLLMAANLLWGSFPIPAQEVWHILRYGTSTGNPAWAVIIWQSRFPQMCTALLCGTALSTCGLMLQTTFRNPLAGPSILGIDAGANLGVALVMLFFGGFLTLGKVSLGGHLLVVLAAMAGAWLVMLLLLFLSRLLQNQVMLLITGVIISYVTGSLIQLLNYSATEQGVHNFVMWGMGHFGGVTVQRLPIFASLIFAGLLLALLMMKPLNALLLGDRYALNMGVNVRSVHRMLLISTGLLTATTTAFCGPISFLGLTVPHIARLSLGNSDHRTLLPATMLTGAILALLCNLLSTLPSQGTLIPINVITPLIVSPVIFYVIFHQK